MRIVCALSLCFLAAACAHVYAPRPIESNPAGAEFEARARANLEKNGRHEFEAAFADFDDGMKAAVPPEKLEKNWTGMEERWGRFLGIEGARAQPFGKGWAAIVVARFASDVHTFSFFFDPAGKISGSLNTPIAAGQMFIDALGHHHGEWADALSDGQMHDVAPPEKLEKIWDGFESRFGKYERIAEARWYGLYAKVIVTFGHTNVTFNVGLDARGNVTGFHVIDVGEQPSPGSNPSPPQAPQIDFNRQSG